MDPLKEVPREKWPELQDFYRNNWPYGVVGFCLLDTQISYPNIRELCNFKVFCPDGNFSNGYVAVIDQFKYYQIHIRPISKDMTKLEKALQNTNNIDWNRSIAVPAADPEVIDIPKTLCSYRGLTANCDETKYNIHLLNRDSEKIDNLSCPPDTYIGPLKADHINLVNSTWTYYDENTYLFFELLMNSGLTYLLYSSNHEPLTWVTISEAGCLTHLYCLEPYRRKGYAEFLMKHVVNDQLQKGKDLYAYTVEGNVKAEKLFKKLGFEPVGYEMWASLKKESLFID